MTRRPPWLGSLPVAAPRRAAAAPVRLVNPTGLGLASERARANMVDSLRRIGVRDPQVLEAMVQVPRHLFVEPALASRAYEDVALPIGHGQTISKPSTVARMIEMVAAPLSPAARAGAQVLEIGTGCGYQAAVLARVFGQAVSVERLRGLHEQARGNLRALRLSNLRLVFGDGNLGVPQAAPFDAIVVAAAGDAIPDALLEQMKIGARLIAPIGTTRQALHLVERVDREQWQLTVLDAVRFVPLRSGTS
ncbi:MAG: protein-L-isoaspartate(D-aspartate) O-methyltransferase [Burkholderiales bacterium]|nr:protein-L-isoaspartate(D-aspartate) O-methyltransferase [Burkholderiales bacterium]